MVELMSLMILVIYNFVGHGNSQGTLPIWSDGFLNVWFQIYGLGRPLVKCPYNLLTIVIINQWILITYF
jgi:hypothetical protein